MEYTIKWILSAALGILAAFCEQYGLIIILVAVAVVLDICTGLIKAKATGEGLDSGKAMKGFWKKISLFVGLGFGIFLDYAVVQVLEKADVSLSIDLPFALIIAAYIILPECISIAENLVQINPEIIPKWVSNLLKAAKDDIDDKGE